MKIGDWIVISEHGLWADLFDPGSRSSFPSKREALASVSSAKLDPNRKPRVKRLSSGRYLYYPKDCDTGRYGEEFLIEKITADNIARYEAMAEES